MTTNPMAKQDAILASVQDDAVAIRNGGPRRARLASALLDAKGHTSKGTQDDCKVAIAALASVQDEARGLAGAHNGHVQACVSAATTVLHQLQGIRWGTALPTLSVGGFADVKPGDTPFLTLTLNPIPPAGVTATVAVEGLDAADLADGQLSRQVVVQASSSVSIPFAQRQLAATKTGTVKVTAPGVKLAQAGFQFRLLANTVTQQSGPPPLELATYLLRVDADPSSFSRVVAGLRLGTAVRLAPGNYGFTSIHVPGCLFYADQPGTVFVDGRVELHEAATAVLGLDIGGGLVLDAVGTRASRCTIHGSDSVDLVSVQGASNILDRCSVSDFAGIGVGVQAKSARDPLFYGLHVFGQRSSGPPSSATMFMIGHSHVDSGQPVNGHYERILIEGARSHDGFEIKSSDNTVVDVTAIGCDVMQRHGIRAATFLSCWAEPAGGQGGRIQLNSNNPKAVRCHGLLAVAAGNGSVEDLLDKSGGNSIYPFANGAEAHHHDGLVEVGNLFSAQRRMPPVGTLLDACPAVKTVAGTYGAATPIQADRLPPPARRLTAADVGPSVA